MKVKLKDTVKQNQVYIWAFSLPFFIMLFLFIINFIYPFGNQSFMFADMKVQYLPFLIEFYDKIKSGESLYFSWNTGLGNSFISVYAYYLATPLYWLCVLIPKDYLIEFMSYLVVVKIGLCGLTSCVYLSRHFNTKRRFVALFSLFYALSGYTAAYAWNVMWLDCILLAPLIILGLEELVKNKKYKLYCITLAASILSNYYLSLIICIYLVFYFFIVLLPFAKEKIGVFLRFALFSLLSGGISAVLLFPVIKQLPLSPRATSGFPDTLQVYSSTFGVLARHFMNVTVETVDYRPHYWPNIYCSVAVFIFVPLFLLNSKINLKKKISQTILLLIMLTSFSYNITSYIWHGFTYPNALPARQSFLYILLMLTICLETFLHIREITKKEAWITLSITAVFLLSAILLVKDEDFTPETFLSTTGFLIIYAVFLCLYLNHKLQEHQVAYLIAIIVIAEAMGNSMATGITTTLRTQPNYETYSTLSATQTASDNGKFYRFDNKNRKSENDSLFADYPSLSLFSSTGNGLVNNYYKKYGVYGTSTHMSSDGATPLMYALLSGGYTFSSTLLPDTNLYEEVAIENHVALYRNRYSVPLGFCIPTETSAEEPFIEDYDTVISSLDKNEKRAPLESQNRLVTYLGASTELFEPFTCEDFEGYSTITVTQDSYVYAYCDTGEFLDISAKTGDMTFRLTNAFHKYLFDLGYHKAGTTITLYGENAFSNDLFPDSTFDGKLHVSAGGLNLTSLDEVIPRLNQNTMTVDSMTSDSLSGSVTADEDGYLVLSIPYDPGFTAMVDGAETTTYVFDDMMIAIPLNAGEHSISLKYYPSGLKAGIIVSLCSLTLFLLICIAENLRNKQHLASQDVLLDTKSIHKK